MTSTPMRVRALLPVLVVAAMLALATAPARAGVPQTLTYQGVLANASGQPITTPNGSPLSMTFRLYDGAGGTATLVHTETQSVVVTNGVFNVTLGAVTPFPTTAVFDKPYYIEVTVGVETLAPRQPLTSSAYALRASMADGLSSTATIQASQVVGGGSGALEFLANGVIGERIVPGPAVPSIVGGSSANSITTGIDGAFIGGGGTSATSITVSGRVLPCTPNCGNSVGSNFSVVAGGAFNSASGQGAAVVSGGFQNAATGSFSTVGGGRANTASGGASVVGGGFTNTASAIEATIAGGAQNTVSANLGFVGGGAQNTVSVPYGAVVGGDLNGVSGASAIVGGGESNTVSGSFGAVVGGENNSVNGDHGFVGGGGAQDFVGSVLGVTCPPDAVTGFRCGNRVTDAYGAVGGGAGNLAGDAAGTTTDQPFATVSGGFGNGATRKGSAVGGGLFNVASAPTSVVSGGSGNTASGLNSVVAGGAGNVAAGDYSFAAGNQAVASSLGQFVWSDRSVTGAFDPSTAGQSTGFAAPANTFSARAAGGVWFVTGVDGFGVATSGVRVNAGSGTWASTSDRASKANLREIDVRDVLSKVLAMPLTSWNYIAEGAHVRHLGPMAQDFHAAFGLGPSDKTIAVIDAEGVALAAIQGLDRKVEAALAEKNVLIARQAATIDELKADLARIKAALGLVETAGR